MVSKKAKLRWKNTYRGRQADLPLDHIGHLDLRVGIIRDIVLNPNATHKYLFASVNMGDIYSVVVGAMLVHHYEEEELIDKMVVCCCNVKMPWGAEDDYTNFMVASLPDVRSKFELLCPPEGAEPGDIITVPGYPRDPASPYMDPNAKIWDQVSEVTEVNNKGEVLYKSQHWVIEGKPGFVHTKDNFSALVRIV